MNRKYRYQYTQAIKFLLLWVELKANIMGPTDLYVKSGSDINLTCKILQGPHELGNIFWYKGKKKSKITENSIKALTTYGRRNKKTNKIFSIKRCSRIIDALI
uniref:Ig-like domain-containing protein n=1 Tax=Glossina pallidipes TaxID=7398 RepID=A0A1A9ZNM7_GLOPL